MLSIVFFHTVSDFNTNIIVSLKKKANQKNVRMIASQQRRLFCASTFAFWLIWIAIFVVVHGRSATIITIRSIDAFVLVHPQPSSPTFPLMVRRYTGTKSTTSWLSTRSMGTPLSSSTSLSSTTTMSHDILTLRGGGGGGEEIIVEDDNDDSNNEPQPPNDLTETLLISEDTTSPTLHEEVSQPQHFSTTAATSSLVLFPTMMINVLRQWSSQYTFYLQQYPIRTKSVTAGLIFAMSDLLAQVLTKSSDKDDNDATTKIVWTRVLSSAAVGFFYFGPAAHYWYSWIFRILPSTSLFSTLQKAILGQLFFGPSFTCIFFAMSLIQSRTFTISNWIQKIRNDLPSAWIAGAGYWPIVDLISYSYVPPQYIPLFVNICSFFWTTYLVVKSYK
jgi:hypothetical protein